MSSQRVRFTFEGEQVGEPLIYRLGHEFPVVTNIRMADVEHDFGWVILQIDGDATDVDRAIEWMRAHGVRVDPVSGDIVEG